MQCCGSGFVRIPYSPPFCRIGIGILGNGHADPDTDLYQRQAYEKVDKLNIFQQNFNMVFKKIKNYDTFNTDEKKHC